MSIWNWVHESAQSAIDNEDGQRQQLYAIWRESRQLESVPDAVIEALERGRRLAVSLGEAWWALFFEHWKLQTLLNHKNDNTKALPLAVAATVEARKPAYNGCPQRLCVHDDLMSAYLSLDGVGYAKEIEEALAYMQDEVSDDAECRFCILQNRVELTEMLGEPEALRRAAAKLLRTAQEAGDSFNAVYGHAWMCLVVFRSLDPTGLGMHAAEGAALCADKVDLPAHKAEFLAWRAVLARQDGDVREGTWHLRYAEASLEQTARPPSMRYFTALRAFHAAEPDKLLALHERELATIFGKSQNHREACVRLEMCRLLAEQGKPFGEAVEAAREAIARLRKPAEMLASLEQVAVGGETPVMNDREWLADFELDARSRGDGSRLRLLALMFEADLHRETDPDRMLALLDEGRHLAKRLREPWWELFYDDRRAGALMKYKGDVRAGLELAVRNALVARKPQYERFPWRFRIHDHLIVGYLNTDPIGYADTILEALTYLEREVPQVGSPRYLVLARRRWLAAELGRLAEARTLAWRGLSMAAEDPDVWTGRSHAVFCYSHLCEIAWQVRDLAELEESAQAGEELAKQTSHQLEQSEFGTWLAVVARQRGDEKRAALHFANAARRVAQLGMPPDHIYFDAVCGYHEPAGEWQQVVAARRAELALLAGKERWAAETRCRTLLCRALAKLGLPVAEEMAAAREVARRLRKPEVALAQIDASGCEPPEFPV